MRFYLVDRVTELEVNKSIEGTKCWSISEDVFEDHFPGFPIVPGVYLIESMAQLLGTLIEQSYNHKFKDEHAIYAVLSIVHKAKFKRFLIPGDLSIMKGTLKTLDKTYASGSVQLSVDSKEVAEADLSFMLISKKDLPNDRLKVIRDEYFNIITEGHQKREQTTR